MRYKTAVRNAVNAETAACFPSCHCIATNQIYVPAFAGLTMNRIREHLVVCTLVACSSVGCQTSKDPAMLAENFRRAAYRGNLATMRRIFEKSPAVLESRSDLGRVFHFPKRAASTPPLFEELEPHRFTALHYAVYMFRTNAVVWLLAKGAEVNASDVDGVTPLHQAANLSNITLVKILLDHCANIHALTVKNRTPLHWAAVGGDLNTIKLLLEQGADPSVTDSAGRTPAMDAARNEHWEIAAYLEKSAAKGTRH